MRMKIFLAAAAAICAPLLVGAPEAHAGGRDVFVAPEGGLDFPKGMRRWSDKHRGPCEGQQSMCGDPYAYRYIQRAWYPYHSSRYWVSADEMRYRYRYQFEGPKYRYYPAWGASDERYEHQEPARRPLK